MYIVADILSQVYKVAEILPHIHIYSNADTLFHVSHVYVYPELVADIYILFQVIFQLYRSRY